MPFVGNYFVWAPFTKTLSGSSRANYETFPLNE